MPAQATQPPKTAAPRERILEATQYLLAHGGRDAVSTRAVCALAKVQAQTIYRHFKDMQGLLDAAAGEAWSRYMEQKISRAGRQDPVAELGAGWDAHVAFGLANPAVYVITFGSPRPGAPSAIAGGSFEALAGVLERVAAAGRLRVPVTAAAAIIHSTGVGVTLTLIAAQENGHLNQYMWLSEAVREAVFSATVAGDPDRGDASAPLGLHAIALKALLPSINELIGDPEAALMGEWLDRIAAS